MGSLCSSCCGNRDDDIYESEQNDKTNLLGNPVGETSRTASQSISNRHASTNNGDQQDKLNKILQKTANSYIDVPALNSPVDQPVDKTKNYDAIVQATLQKHSITRQSEKSCLLKDMPNVERTLSEEPLTENDRKMVKEANLSMLAALKGIQVQNSESLVIPFDAAKESQKKVDLNH